MITYGSSIDQRMQGNTKINISLSTFHAVKQNTSKYGDVLDVGRTALQVGDVDLQIFSALDRTCCATISSSPATTLVFVKA